MKTNLEREQYLLENGWVLNKATNRWEKPEWEHEAETLGIEAHLCPHWYYPGDTLEDAYEQTLVENTIKASKSEVQYETSQILERLILDAMNGSDWSDIRSAVSAFARRKLLPWYLSECKGKPNPFILKNFNIQ